MKKANDSLTEIEDTMEKLGAALKHAPHVQKFAVIAEVTASMKRQLTRLYAGAGMNAKVYIEVQHEKSRSLDGVDFDDELLG